MIGFYSYSPVDLNKYRPWLEDSAAWNRYPVCKILIWMPGDRVSKYWIEIEFTCCSVHSREILYRSPYSDCMMKKNTLPLLNVALEVMKSFLPPFYFYASFTSFLWGMKHFNCSWSTLLYKMKSSHTTMTPPGASSPGTAISKWAERSTGITFFLITWFRPKSIS